jgi:rRNA maturation protein Nop10
MARTYYVKRAQQRYETKPVLDPETGQQKVTPKMRRGVQMTSKSGRPVFMKVTERDLTRPKPMPKCSKCGTVIAVGQPYKYTETFNRTIIRCGPCPAPQVWEYSSSLSARLAEIQHNASEAMASATDYDSLIAARDETAEAVRELAQEKEDSAQNIEDGFGHETEQCNELRDIAEQLNSWADEIADAEIAEEPEPEEEDCPECGGTGTVEEPEEPDRDCEECDGTGQITPEELSEDDREAWLEEARSALDDVLGSCPV